MVAEVVEVVGVVVAEAGMVRRVECVRSIPFLVMIRGVFLIGKWPSTGLEGWREGSGGSGGGGSARLWDREGVARGNVAR